jgi:SAM-dependent methyltransferase
MLTARNSKQWFKGDSKWDEFAKRDPLGYICTDLRGKRPEAFWASGEKVIAEEIVPVLAEMHVPLETAVEIGCGVGRLLIPLSRHFKQVIGLDVSRVMILRAQENCSERGICNVKALAVPGPEEALEVLSSEIGKVSFVYSLLVFQHIEDMRVIGAYLTVVARLLSPAGIGYLQFDTRPRTFFYYIKTALPDCMLPRFWRRGVRRIRRDPGELEAALKSSGLAIVGERGARGPYHRYLVRRIR